MRMKVIKVVVIVIVIVIIIMNKNSDGTRSNCSNKANDTEKPS